MLDEAFAAVEGPRVQIKRFDFVEIAVAAEFDKPVLLHVLVRHLLLHVHFKLEQFHQLQSVAVSWVLALARRLLSHENNLSA